jgi:hypothetical protein
MKLMPCNLEQFQQNDATKERTMNWFEDLTGCDEQSPERVRQQLFLDGGRLCSRVNGQSWLHGTLELPTVSQLRQRVRECDIDRKPNLVCEIVGNVQQLHRDSENYNALLQVASQFNLLEMVSPDVTPEDGIGIYERDFTQGPACAIAAGAGTIFRNYFVEVDGHTGQSSCHQLDCLAGVGRVLGNTNQRLWQMANGYALPSAAGLSEINRWLGERNPTASDEVRQALQIGIQLDTQVTLGAASHTVSQAYCSAMPVAYTSHGSHPWEPFARLILEAAYEATFCAAILNKARTGCDRLFLTMLGGGAFGNRLEWILAAIRRSLIAYPDFGLNIAIVSYRASNRDIQQLVQEFAATNE